MKRFIGLLLTGVGGGVTLWGGFHVLTGQSTVNVTLANNLSISALMGGLIGVALFTLGLLWVRD